MYRSKLFIAVRFVSSVWNIFIVSGYITLEEPRFAALQDRWVEKWAFH